MANNNWNNYTEKNAALTDKDEIMLRDSTDGKNKRSPLSKIWNYMVDKMATAVISKLETDNKTIIGAINYLYGNRLIGKSKVLNKNEVWNFSISYNCILMFCPSNEILSTVILSSNRYYNIGTGRLDAVSISVKNSTVKLTSLVDWPVRYNIIGI